MITRELTSITSSGKVQNGILDPNDLDENERKLMDKYLDYKVCATYKKLRLHFHFAVGNARVTNRFGRFLNNFAIRVVSYHSKHGKKFACY